MVDPAFSDPRLAVLYDPLDADRSDLDVYAKLLGELEARSVLDIGCGTGRFAVLLAARGLEVIGVDPAEASLDVARRKPGADRVRWVRGDASALPPMQVDVATMTGNVAQVFVTDDEWSATLRAARRALRPGGYLVFETRDPRARAWQTWTRDATYRRAEVAGVGTVQSWVELTDVARTTTGTAVSFRSTFRFDRDGTVLTSDSTLRFRGQEETTASLHAAGFTDVRIRDAPDRPGLELVFVAQSAA